MPLDEERGTGISMKSHNLFNSLQKFDLGPGRQGAFYSLPALEKAGLGPISRLPVSIRIVLESEPADARWVPVRPFPKQAENKMRLAGLGRDRISGAN